MTRLPAACLFWLLTLAPAWAGPLKPQWVPADASWLVHIDVKAISESTVGGFFLEHAEEFDLDLDEIRDELGIDPARDIFSATLFGDAEDEEDVTVVLLMSPAIEETLEKLREERGYRTVEIDGYRLHHWDEDGEGIYAYVGDTDRRNRRLVVLAEDRSRVLKALAVIEDDAPSLSSRRAVIKDRPRSGSLLFATAVGLPWLEDDDGPASAIIERSDRFVLECRESKETTTVDLTISARSDRDAENITDVIRGLLALGRLIVDEMPELADLSHLLDAIRVRSDGNDIGLRIRADSRELIEFLSEAAEQAR